MTTATLVCGSCGAELAGTPKFCGECGASLAATTPAEYKQVTVLFADVVHSMDRAKDGDIQEAHGSVDRFVAMTVGAEGVLDSVELLHARALLARADGDRDAYREYVGRYLDAATRYGFEGHVAIARAMT